MTSDTCLSLVSNNFLRELYQSVIGSLGVHILLENLFLALLLLKELQTEQVSIHLNLHGIDHIFVA